MADYMHFLFQYPHEAFSLHLTQLIVSSNLYYSFFYCYTCDTVQSLRMLKALCRSLPFLDALIITASCLVDTVNFLMDSQG
jgi:hypothetical protein